MNFFSKNISGSKEILNGNGSRLKKFFFKTVSIILINVGGFLCVLSVDSLFTNHTYAASVKNSHHLQFDNVSEFYKKLSKEKGEFSIIEYPVIVQNSYNPFPYYQSLHQKKVLNGYFLSRALKKQWGIRDILDADIWLAEIILSRLENNKIDISKITDLFTNIIYLYDISAIRNSRAKYIILHKHIMEEIINIQKDLKNNTDFIKDPDSNISRHVYNFSRHFKNYYYRYFGKPVFEDQWLIIFQI
jgi:hypothetical protein